MPLIKNIVFGVSKQYSPQLIQATVIGNISVGSSHSVYIKNTGVGWAWGANSNGQLGDNSVISKPTPVSVLGATKTFCQIAAGRFHTIGIDKNGQVWAWGFNTFGQVGDNSTSARLTPVSIGGTSKTFCKISGGATHTVAIDKNGQVWAWGLNTSGQLGDNTTISKRTPVSVLGATKTFCQISGGVFHTVAIDKNGQAWGWGNNGNGRLGDNTTISKRTPVSVLGATKTFCQIAGGGFHTIGIDKNGQAWAWGLNSVGQLGDNTVTSRRTPVSVLGAAKTFCQISAGDCHTVAIDKNGQAWAWGLNSSGRLGDNTTTQRLTPVSVAGATKTFCKISAGQGHSLAIDKNGQVWAWGLNTSGQLGNNSLSSEITPISVVGAIKTFCHISTGECSTITIDKDGQAWAWGLNSNGQIGDNTDTPKLTPVSVLGATKTFCQIAGGVFHTIGIDKNGQVWAWGLNNAGQLGDNTAISKRTPVSVLGATKTFCQITGGRCHSIAIDKNGQVWAWGLNTDGRLGDNTTISKRTPVSVLGATKTFCQISGGGFHTVAIDKNGQAWGWGLNNFGQLGDNTSTQRLTPVSVAGATKTFCKISAGGSHNIAIDKNGQLWTWGLNTGGQLGDNTTTNRLTPVSILGAPKTFCKISAGGSHTVAIDKNGQVWAWGLNNFGRLGDNTITSRRTPTSIEGIAKTFCHISAGFAHTVAIDKDGQAWAWGLNTSGQLGNDKGDRLTPVKICNI